MAARRGNYSPEEQMQAQIDQLSEQVGKLVTQVTEQGTTQKLNHEQNRRDIHNLFNGQQRFVDAMAAGFDKIAVAMEKALEPIRADILDLQLWKSKTTGYVLGLSALSAAVFKVVESLVGHAIPK